jgi:hypothetical protein
MSDGFVEAAMVAGAVAPRDERGLMPLAGARALVQAAREFRKGGGRMVGDTWVLDSDVLWAALMSLANAAEFVREATRLCWFFHPRGQDNTAPLERYGEAILPWLASFVRPDGRLVNVPWCVEPCLLAIGRAEVFALLWGVTCVSEGTGDGWPGPFAADDPGDADRRSGVDLDAPAPAAPDEDADGLVIAWLYAHPDVGFPLLARRAGPGDARARHMLKSLAQCGPSEIFDPVRDALGEEEARALFAAAGAPAALDEGCILATLNGALPDDWPALFGDAPERAYHALRLVAARAREGDGWGIVVERLEGDDLASAALRPYVYGSNVASGPLAVDEELPFSIEAGEERAPESPFDLDGVRVDGPRGPLELRTALIAAGDLRPGWATAPGLTSTRFSLMLRAYLTAHPDAFWNDPDEAAAWLGLGEDVEVIVVSDAFQHCVGPDGPDTYPAAWRVPPGASPVFVSLARALVQRDPGRFEPGQPNLDFRLHALARVAAEHGGDA